MFLPLHLFSGKVTALALLLFAGSLSANSFFTPPAKLQAEPEFLDVDEAFVLNSKLSDGRLTLSWRIAPDYFLYHHSLKVEWIDQGSITELTRGFASSPAVRKSDPYFGQVGVHYHYIELNHLGFKPRGELKVSYQGCAEDGLCYPTQTKIVIANN